MPTKCLVRNVSRRVVQFYDNDNKPRSLDPGKSCEAVLDDETFQRFNALQLREKQNPLVEVSQPKQVDGKELWEKEEDKREAAERRAGPVTGSGALLNPNRPPASRPKRELSSRPLGVPEEQQFKGTDEDKFEDDEHHFIKEETNSAQQLLDMEDDITFAEFKSRAKHVIGEDDWPKSSTIKKSQIKNLLRMKAREQRSE